MKRLLFVLILISSATFVKAQENVVDENSVDATIGGMGLGISLNYSRTITEKGNYFVVASVVLAHFLL